MSVVRILNAPNVGLLEPRIRQIILVLGVSYTRISISSCVSSNFVRHPYLINTIYPFTLLEVRFQIMVTKRRADVVLKQDMIKKIYLILKRFI